MVSEWDKHSYKYLVCKRRGPSGAVLRATSTRDRLRENEHGDVGKRSYSEERASDIGIQRNDQPFAQEAPREQASLEECGAHKGWDG